jgi:hypothetical protein
MRIMSDKQTPEQKIEAALSQPDAHRIYSNGFINAIGNGDVIISLMLNNRPVANVNLSYTVAKTLAIRLGGLISTLEEKTGNTIMTTEDIDKALKEKKE